MKALCNVCKIKLNLLELIASLVIILTIFYSQVAHASLPTKDEITNTQPIHSEATSNISDTEDDCIITNADKVVEVPSQAKRIQEAINQIANKGIVIVRPGVYIENITIPTGKKIILQGANRKKTRILSNSNLKPTIVISGGAQVCINGLTIKGGSIGIKVGEFLHKENNEAALGNPAKSLTVKFTDIESADRGLIANAEKITIHKSTIRRNFDLGGYIISPHIEITGTDIISNFGLGLVSLSNAECTPSGTFYTANFENNEIRNNDGPGLTFCGPSDVTVRGCNFADNLEGSIKILEQSSGSTILTSNTIQFTEADDGLWGDGVIAINSPDIEIVGNVIGYNDRAGLYFNNSGGLVAVNVIFNNLLSIALEEGADPIVSESNIIYGNEQNEVTLGAGLEPAPPPEVPDLED
jgi:hypothetical protein